MNKTTIFVTAILIISLGTNFSILRRYQNNIESQTGIPVTSEQVSPSPAVLSPAIAYPVVRIPTRTNYMGWREYRYPEYGIGYYYPPSWVPSEHNIYSKSYEPDEKPRGLINDESKWDIDFRGYKTNVSFSQFAQDSLAGGAQSFQVSRTVVEWPIYFIEPPDPEIFIYGDQIYSLHAYIKTPQGIISMRGYSGTQTNGNIAILKEIAESIHPL